MWCLAVIPYCCHGQGAWCVSSCRAGNLRWRGWGGVHLNGVGVGWGGVNLSRVGLGWGGVNPTEVGTKWRKGSRTLDSRLEFRV